MEVVYAVVYDGPCENVTVAICTSRIVAEDLLSRLEGTYCIMEYEVNKPIPIYERYFKGEA